MRLKFLLILFLFSASPAFAQLSPWYGGTGMLSPANPISVIETSISISWSPAWLYTTIQLSDTALSDTLLSPVQPGQILHIFQAIAPDTATGENVIVCAKGFNGKGSTGAITLGTGVGNGVTLMSYQSPVDSKLYWATVQGDNYTVN